jgi:hypothetical protein
LELLAREGDAAPGTPAGTVFGTLDGNNGVKVSLNESGQVAFNTVLLGPGAGQAFFIGSPSALSLVARQGDIAPGTGGGTFSAFDIQTSKINRAGQTIIRGTVSGGDVTTDNGGSNSCGF